MTTGNKYATILQAVIKTKLKIVFFSDQTQEKYVKITQTQEKYVKNYIFGHFEENYIISTY